VLYHSNTSSNTIFIGDLLVASVIFALPSSNTLLNVHCDRLLAAVLDASVSPDEDK
jgi:hypothetical protein